MCSSDLQSPGEEPRRLSPEMDVWTFGVLLWEVFMLGRMPDCVTCATELCKPLYATTALDSVMRSCWTLDPRQRSSFSKLADKLRGMLGAEARLDKSKSCLEVTCKAQNEEASN